MGLDLVELVMSAEERFGIALPDEEVENLRTPRKMVDYISKRLPPGTASYEDVEETLFGLIRETTGTPEFDPDADFSSFMST